MFKSEALDMQTWFQIFVIAFGVLFVVEIKRYIDAQFKTNKSRK
jgi:hypothetical protein